MKMWDPLMQIPFEAKIFWSDADAEVCKMTVKFTDFRGDFVEQCLQNLCQQQGAQTCARCLVPNNRFHEPACNFEPRDSETLITFWTYGIPEHFRAYTTEEILDVMGKLKIC
jgi:hypothetical protein